MRQLIEYSNEPATISSLRDHKLIEVNDAFLQRTGYTRKEAIGRTSIELGLWDNELEYRSIGEELASTEFVRHRTIKYRTKDGALRMGIFSAAIRELEGEPRVISLITDATESMRAQEEQRRSERRLRSYIEHAPDDLLVIGQDSHVTFAAPSLENLLGFVPDWIVGKDWCDLVYPDDLSLWTAALDALARSGGSQPVEIRARHSSGQLRSIEGTLTILPASAEDPQQIVFNWRDVTQRKGDQERLRNIEGRLRDIINHSPIVVTEFDAHGTIVIAEGRGVRIVSSAVGSGEADDSCGHRSIVSPGASYLVRHPPDDQVWRHARYQCRNAMALAAYVRDDCMPE